VLSPTRLTGAGAVAAAAVLALGACGTNNNSTPTTSGAPGTSGASGASGASAAPAPSKAQCASGTLTASGSTAQANAMSAWIKGFQQACSSANVNYGGGGSGQGVTQFTAGSTDFAGSDFPLSSAQKPAADQRCGTGSSAIDLPMVPGPIAVAYNLPGVTNLQLSAATLAGIFSGKITKWDDAEIKKDNPGVTLPATGIQTFHRSDGSGTTFNFTNYLQNDAKSAWTFGHDKTWSAPGGQGAKGSASVAQGIKSTAGGVGYIEQSFATQNNLPFAKVGNAAGQFVQLSSENTVNFLSKAQPASSGGGDLALKLDYANPDPNAYPAVLVTYEIVCQKGNKPDKLPLLKGFLTYISGTGQDLLPQAGYVKLPSSLQSQVSTAISSLG